MKNFFKIIILFIVFYLSSCKQDLVIPVVRTSPVTSVSYTSATAGGMITDDGGEQITEVGICWSTNYSPTIADNKDTQSGTSESFTANISGLNLNTTYFVRAYATSKAGIGYGNAISFRTLSAGTAAISTVAVSSVTANAATTGGNITDESGAHVTERGICWSIQNNPTISGNKLNLGSGPGIFSGNIINLVRATTYYVRAYAINSVGVSYGNEISFATSAELPTVYTAIITDATSTSATGGGEVTNTGGAAITETGVCWSTTPGPLVTNNKSASTTTTGAFTSAIAGLLGSTTYYVRAYAANSTGTAYGNEVSFTTSAPVAPVLTTADVKSVTTSAFTSGGNITSSGGALITAKGICWNTTGNPTIASSKTSDETGTGEYSSNASNLQRNTLYYVRSYATNQVGTSYGQEIIARTYDGVVNDIDGNTYYTTTIGTQTWMAQDLRTTKYRNGDPIGTTTPANLDITSETTPKYQWAYGGNESNAAIYGRLYTWFAATDSRQVCPSGWHVATDIEWLTLEDYMMSNGFNYDGSTGSNKIAKALSGTTLWKLVGFTGAVGNPDYPLYKNKSGFSAIPGGFRSNRGHFSDLGQFSSWWLSTEIGASAWTRNIYYSNTGTNKVGNLKTEMAYSIRCVKD